MESKDFLRIFILSFCFLGGVYFFSGNSLKEVVFVRAPADWPTTVNAGELVFMNPYAGWPEIAVNGNSLSAQSEIKKLFFSAGVSGRKTLLISSERKVKNRIEIARGFINVIYPEAKQKARIRLPASVKANLEQTPDEVVRQERLKIQRAILDNENSPAEKEVCWSMPLMTKITGAFASQRRVDDRKVYYHSGVDMRASVGFELRAPAAGTVVLAEKFTYPGNLIVLNHGNGVFSRYLHLSQFLVKAGDHVRAGDLIGKTGMTGRAEAPHLHWEILWKGMAFDPLAFVERWNQTFECPVAERPN